MNYLTQPLLNSEELEGLLTNLDKEKSFYFLVFGRELGLERFLRKQQDLA